MTTKYPPKRILDFNLEMEKIQSSTQMKTLLWRTFMRSAAGVAWAYTFFLIVGVTAGHYTEVAVKVLGSLTINGKVSFAIAGGGVGYGILQKIFRRKTVSQLAKQIKRLEQLIDPERLGSGLPSNGATKKEDRV